VPISWPPVPLSKFHTCLTRRLSSKVWPTSTSPPSPRWMRLLSNPVICLARVRLLSLKPIPRQELLFPTLGRPLRLWQGLLPPVTTFSWSIVNNPGNPRVKNSDPYPYPSKPVPVPHGHGFTRVGVGVRKNPGVNITRGWGRRKDLADAPQTSIDIGVTICEGLPRTLRALG
jgi:hypothetical protein